MNSEYKKLLINGVNYSRYMRLPFTFQKTLNEQLDSAVVELFSTPLKEPFKPFDKAILGYDSYIVAEDIVTEIVGRNLYNHSITLLEETKDAERIICGAKSFTMPLVADYTKAATLPNVQFFQNMATTAGADTIWYRPQSTDVDIEYPMNDEAQTKSIVAVGDSIVIPKYLEIVPPKLNINQYLTSANIFVRYNKTGLGVYAVDRSTASRGDVDFVEAVGTTYPQSFIGASLTSRISWTPTEGDGVYSFIYEVYEGAFPKERFLFNVYVAKNANTKPRLKICDVVNRLLETSETLRYNLDSPRYRLEYSSEQAPMMEQDAPEFHFANGRSLWENLREIGQYIHAIPRITDGVLTFDELGGMEKASLRFGRKIKNSTALNIEDYTAGLDSAVDNLINQDDLNDGSITEPYDNAYVTMRTVGDTARIQEETGVLLTAYPVEKIISLKVASFTHNGNTYPEIDITPHVFEKSEYDMLSSASGAYPLSKTYAIYYQQGQQNISGFWYRAQDKVTNLGNSLEDYAITNILKAIYGVAASKLDGLNYISALKFNITYIPSVSARLRQYKPNYKGNFNSVMAYNQSANRLSAVAYGENLRGQLAMMGNTTATVTYMFPDVEHVPEAGQLFDDKRYITSVTTRVFKDFVIAEMTLAEGYNELGAYVETNNKIRQFEIPSSRDRYTLLEEFCVISDHKEAEDPNMAAKTLKDYIITELSVEAPAATDPLDVTLALAVTRDYEGRAITPYGVALPVMSLAVGNSLYFGFRFEDNVNAGVASEASLNRNAKYRMAKGVPYGDAFYSEALSLQFGLYTQTSGAADHENLLPEARRSYGDNAVVSTDGNTITWHKDSAEACCVTYQMHFLTDSDFIIGDGLAYCCRAVRRVVSDSPAVLYFFNKRINPLTGTTSPTGAIYSTFVIPSTTDRMITPAGVPSFSFQSWAIIKDGKFVLGQNSSTIPEHIYFNFKRRLN